MNIDRDFIKVWNLHADAQGNFCNFHDLRIYVPAPVLLFLLSSGSFTRNLSAISSDPMAVTIIAQDLQITLENQVIDEILVSRSIWLYNKSRGNMAFAHSYWAPSFMEYSRLYSNKPVGPFLVESKTDIRRQLLSIYCGYCHSIELGMDNVGILWGRSYYILFQDQPVLHINEIFSGDFTQNLLMFN